MVISVFLFRHQFHDIYIIYLIFPESVVCMVLKENMHFLESLTFNISRNYEALVYLLKYKFAYNAIDPCMHVVIGIDYGHLQ